MKYFRTLLIVALHFVWIFSFEMINNETLTIEILGGLTIFFGMAWGVSDKNSEESIFIRVAFYGSLLAFILFLLLLVLRIIAMIVVVALVFEIFSSFLEKMEQLGKML